MKSLPLRDDDYKDNKQHVHKNYMLYMLYIRTTCGIYTLTEIVTLNICDMRETRELCGLGGVEGEGRSGCI